MFTIIETGPVKTSSVIIIFLSHSESLALETFAIGTNQPEGTQLPQPGDTSETLYGKFTLSKWTV